ncbi:MBL fold metallo-hydrolase [Dactylosporangium sp. CA-092794]|uniref:MBL fold metallo-hydrolase n=1 Tax=Dactylosporangium sp. CA-092794 TaxID=3239929 RepID=UPI003D9391F1
MKITKHAHACVELESDGRRILIDPGTFTPNAAELVDAATAVLVTHEHFDHVDEGLLTTALRRRDDLVVWGPEAVTGRWLADHPGRVHTVRGGDRFTANGLSVEVHGDVHATIHPDIPLVANVGYLVEGSVYHPGDAYHVPAAEVSTLLLPTSGPWTKLGEAADYVRAVGPRTVVQIHELMLSDLGQRSVATFLGPAMLSAVPLTQLAAGESLDV